MERQIALQARLASQQLLALSVDEKNAALAEVKKALIAHKAEILAANEQDLTKAKADLAQGSLSAALFKRLDLSGGPTHAKYETLLVGLDDVQKLDDPTGKITLATKLDEGLELYRVTCPVGVVCVIFEARPEVCIQISSLALKSGNAVILKGGKEAFHSNRILVETFREAISKIPGVPKDAVQLVETRESVAELLNMDDLIDLVIPRGSNDLVRHIKSTSRIPVLGHADGICSVYLDKDAAAEKAAVVAVDSKTNYVAACNAAEKLLVHKDIAEKPAFLNSALALLKAGVTLHMDKKSLAILQSKPSEFQSYFEKAAIVPATEVDFKFEFLDMHMAVMIVDDIHQAILHINTTGSHHTDCIVTEDKKTAEMFMNLIDSAGVYHNASTRFADGFRYGFGAEIGVSTNKIHARGPVGLEGLVIYKYRLYGNGNVVAQYGNQAPLRQYLHTPLAASEMEKHKQH